MWRYADSAGCVGVVHFRCTCVISEGAQPPLGIASQDEGRTSAYFRFTAIGMTNTFALLVSGET